MFAYESEKMKKIRLQKYFTDCGILSRRATESEILKGNITVNGNIATLGEKIDPDTDTVIYRGRTIRPRQSQHTYIMLNKPRGYLSSVTDDRGRECVTSLLSGVKRRVYPVGRLDLYSEGLLLLTDDGELTNALTHPKGQVPKIYRVKIKGKIDSVKLEILNSAMEIDGLTLLPAIVKITEEHANFTLLEMTLFEGKNRQIRKMCASLDLVVMGLRRIAIDSLTLGGLPVGKWRHLTDNEINSLKKFL